MPFKTLLTALGCLIALNMGAYAANGSNNDSRVYTFGGRTFVDSSLLVSGAIQGDKYVELVNISTPTTPATSHARMFLNGTTRQICAVFDNGNAGCISASNVNSVVGGLGINASSAGGITTVGLSTPIANGSIDSSSVTKQGNLFNGNSQLVQTGSTGLIPNSLLDASSITKQGNTGFVSTTATNTWTANQTFSSATITTLYVTTFTPTGIVGTTIADAANTGNVGERVVARVLTGSSVPMTPSNAWVTITTITVTGGDWDVTGQCSFNLNASVSPLDFSCAISTFTNNTTTDHVSGDNILSEGIVLTANAPDSVTIANYRISVAASTPVYLKGDVEFGSGGPPKGFGRLSARRVR